MAEAKVQAGPKVLETKKNDQAFGAQTANVIIEGESPDAVNSLDAKHLAYAERTKLGMERSGIEPIGGSYPVETGEKNEDGTKKLMYRREFKLTEMI